MLCEDCWLLLWSREQKTIYRRYCAVTVPVPRYETPEQIYGITVWQMAAEAMNELGSDRDFIQLERIREAIRKKYPRVNEETINEAVRSHCINIHSRGSLSEHGTASWLSNPQFAWDGHGGFRLLTKKEKTTFKTAYILGHPMVEKKFYPIKELHDVAKELLSDEVKVDLIKSQFGSPDQRGREANELPQTQGPRPPCRPCQRRGVMVHGVLARLRWVDFGEFD
jgi:hypothetical protein